MQVPSPVSDGGGVGMDGSVWGLVEGENGMNEVEAQMGYPGYNEQISCFTFFQEHILPGT